MPRDSFSHSTVVAAPRSKVWTALDLPETWNIAGVERVREPVIDEQGRLCGFKFDSVVGGVAYEGRATPHTRVEGEAMSWDIANSQVTGLLHIELEDADDGATNMNVGVDIQSVGFLSAVFFGAITKAVRDGLPRAAADLASDLADRRGQRM